MRQTMGALEATQQGVALSRADASRVVLALHWGSHPLLQERTLGRDAAGGVHLRTCERSAERTRCDLVSTWTSRCSCAAEAGGLRSKVEAEELCGALEHPSAVVEPSWELAWSALQRSAAARSAVLQGVHGPESSRGELRGRVVTALSHRACVGEDSVRAWVQTRPSAELCAALGGGCSSRGACTPSVLVATSSELSAARAAPREALGLAGCTQLARVGVTCLLQGSACAVEVVGARAGRVWVEAGGREDLTRRAEVACVLAADGTDLAEAWAAAGHALAL